MFIERQDLVDRFSSRFERDVDGNLYFGLKRLRYSLPVTEDEMFAAVESFRFRSKLAMAATWIMLIPAVGWFSLGFMNGTLDAAHWLILLAGWYGGILIHGWAFSSA